MSKDKTIKIELESYILYDKLAALAIEYATTVDALVNISIARMLNDIEFVRDLRMGKFEFIHRQDGRI